MWNFWIEYSQNLNLIPANLGRIKGTQYLGAGNKEKYQPIENQMHELTLQ